MATEKIIEAFDKWGLQLVTDTKKAIDDSVTHQGGQTSDLSGSVNYKVLNTNGKITFTLTMNKYWYWFDKGRAANKKAPPAAAIKSFLEKKGFSQSKANQILLSVNAKHKGIGKKLGGNKISHRNLKTISFDKKLTMISWLFAKSIGKKGTKPHHFIDKVITDERIEDLKTQLKPLLKEQYLLEIKQAFT